MAGVHDPGLTRNPPPSLLTRDYSLHNIIGTEGCFKG